MEPFDYLLCQMELEGIRRVPDGLIIPGSPDVDDFPLVLTARTSDGQHLVCLDASLPAEIRLQLSKHELADFNTGKAIEILEKSGLHIKAGYFKTHVFPDGIEHPNLDLVRCFDGNDPKVIAFGFNGLADKVYAIEDAGRILSACVSSRQNTRAAEAWVYTHPDHRRKGYAQQVVGAWAGSLKAEGLIPFYSHAIENAGSARLAESLNLVAVFEEVVLEKATQEP